MKKRVLIVCGSGIATSTAVRVEIEEKLKERGVDIDTRQCDVFGIKANMEGVDLIAYTCKLKEDYGVPAVNAVPLLTGIGSDKVIDEIERALKA